MSLSNKNNGRNFGQNLNHQTSYLLLYKCEVAKLGSQAGNFLSGKRGGGGGVREKERVTLPNWVLGPLETDRTQWSYKTIGSLTSNSDAVE